MKHNTEKYTKNPLYSVCIMSIADSCIMLFLESKIKLIFMPIYFLRRKP